MSMVDNQYVYKLPAMQVALFDTNEIRSLASLRSPESFTYVRADAVPYLNELNQTLFAGDLLGVSLFVLKNKEEVERAHIDRNILRPETSRQCAINFPIDCAVISEWYTDNDAITVHHPIYEEYALRYFPVASNTVLFEYGTTSPCAITTNIPHLGYSVPGGGILVSLGFRQTFEELVVKLKTFA